METNNTTIKIRVDLTIEFLLEMGFDEKTAEDIMWHLMNQIRGNQKSPTPNI